jgi:hypothetical protein
LNSETYFLAMLDSLGRELRWRAYVQSGEASRDLARAEASLLAFEKAFAEYESQHGKKGGAL